ncbi:hypothetical protein MASR2M70_07710 [Bacillota bacterium]
MADRSAKKPTDSSKASVNSIIEKSGILRDLNTSEVSVWRSTDAEDSSDSVNRRFVRERAKHHIDRIIAEKLEKIEAAPEGTIEDIMDKISLERQLKREEYSASHGSRRSKKKRNEAAVIDGSADSRLDLFMDGVIERAAVRRNLVYKTIGDKIQPYTLRLSEREGRLSLQMARKVDGFDIFLDRLIDKKEKEIALIRKKHKDFNNWCHKHRRRIAAAAVTLTIAALSTGMLADHFSAYEYMYNGKVLGIVKNQKDVYDTIDIIGDKLSCEYGAEIAINKEKDISFRKIIGIGKKTDSNDDILNQFTYMRDMNATAYAIKVDGQQKAILYSRECADGILKSIQNNFLVENASITYETIGFAENVEIEEISTKIGNIQKEDAVLEYMLTGAVEIKTYAVKSGDTFGQIAKNLGLSSEELMSTNPNVRPERLQIGQELVLNRVCPVVTVQTTEIAEYIAYMEYDITYEETSALYKGEQTVKSAGVKGQRQVVAEIVRNNGEEVSRNELSSKTISEPRNQVVLNGTKELPPLIGTGKFIYPTRGTLTSRFGSRWGRMHNGIDLAAPTGTKIRAADGGVVISAGWEGALGYCVRIDHGQNKVTVYGHCSKILVKKGDKVYQDQHIANVGSTGRSTGSHLHFELHVNGIPKNPLKYIN